MQHHKGKKTNFSGHENPDSLIQQNIFIEQHQQNGKLWCWPLQDMNIKK